MLTRWLAFESSSSGVGGKGRFGAWLETNINNNYLWETIYMKSAFSQHLIWYCLKHAK